MVEKLLDSREKNDGTRSFLVKWQGFRYVKYVLASIHPDVAF